MIIEGQGIDTASGLDTVIPVRNDHAADYIAAQRLSYDQSKRDEEWSTRCLLAAFAHLGIPESLLDIGCGQGHLVDISTNLGVCAEGFDLFVDYSRSSCSISSYNLMDRNSRRIYPMDMVLCWEVAEHIPIEYSDHLCDMLSSCTLKHLLFSAATPGQGGSGHVNEQPYEYWVDKFQFRGLSLDEEMTVRLRSVFTQVAPACWWYGKNIMVFINTG